MSRDPGAPASHASGSWHDVYDTQNEMYAKILFGVTSGRGPGS